MTEKAKYRVLNEEELTLLEPEFVLFLSSQTITAADWQNLKQNNIGRVQELILRFSDLVFERILGKIDLLEKRLKDQVMFFYFGKDHIDMIGIHLVNSTHTDLRSFDVERDLEKWLNDNTSNAQIIYATKRMKDSRQKEMIAMINMSCEISKNHELYQLLRNLKKETQ